MSAHTTEPMHSPDRLDDELDALLDYEHAVADVLALLGGAR